MRRRMLKSKIHRATVTEADLNYIGSISLDPELMAAADILEHEQVAVLDIDNGARFETYAITGQPGQVCLNGAAARLVHVGDKVIVITYADYEQAELEGHSPTVVHVDQWNNVIPPEEAARAAAALQPLRPRQPLQPLHATRH
ncbi:MAG TPA: aspartate 1-decarboxylase [Acidimicrobiales bacterium]